MTEHARRRLKKSWNFTKTVMLWGLLLGVAQQAVDLRGKVIQQNEQQAATASSVVAVMKDVSKLSGRVLRIDDRVTRLERGAGGGRERVRGPAPPVAADSTASPGPVAVLGQVIAAPFKLFGALWRAGRGG